MLFLRLSETRISAIMAFVGVPYDHNRPWAFWFYVGKIVSKNLFNDPQQLDWFNVVPVNNKEIVVIEVHISRPKPGKELQIFWRPARDMITEHIQLCMYTVNLYDSPQITHISTLRSDRYRSGNGFAC